MSNNNDFPGMPDAFGAFIVTFLGFFLFISIIGIPLALLIDAAPRSKAARITLRIIAGLVIAFVAFVLVVLYAAFFTPQDPTL